MTHEELLQAVADPAKRARIQVCDGKTFKWERPLWIPFASGFFRPCDWRLEPEAPPTRREGVEGMTNLANKLASLWESSTNVGMTFRQYAATHILAGMAASDLWSGNIGLKPEVIQPAVEAAVLAADTLIAKLEEDEGKETE